MKWHPATENVACITFNAYIYQLNAVVSLNNYSSNAFYHRQEVLIENCWILSHYRHDIQRWDLKHNSKSYILASKCQTGESKAAVRVWGRKRVDGPEWRELQQSLHKRGGLCNGCGFVSRRNLGRAKRIQMCQTGTRPTQAASHIRLRTHEGNEGRGGGARVHYWECRVMLSQKHERHAVVWGQPRYPNSTRPRPFNSRALRQTVTHPLSNSNISFSPTEWLTAAMFMVHYVRSGIVWWALLLPE